MLTEKLIQMWKLGVFQCQRKKMSFALDELRLSIGSGNRPGNLRALLELQFDKLGGSQIESNQVVIRSLTETVDVESLLNRERCL